MNICLDIFITFFKIGLISFGGGYAMIPVIQREMEAHCWLDSSCFTDVIAVSAMAPGPIAANSAVLVGFRLSGFLGASIACIGVVLPSFIILLFLGRFLSGINEHPIVKAVFYGLRPTITGIIAYSAMKLALSEGIIGGSGILNIKSIILLTAAFIIIIKTKLNPLLLILSSGLAGILLFR